MPSARPNATCVYPRRAASARMFPATISPVERLALITCAVLMRIG
nr:MAG TPA: hypothetical protein [Caudoviricetes sp.]